MRNETGEQDAQEVWDPQRVEQVVRARVLLAVVLAEVEELECAGLLAPALVDLKRKC